ncbi:MAG: DUF1850 domain-containing protein [Spirochaetes bacterium]|nr:DUF1850 domain-containing protein [Spirochaetota bacterium]
MVLIFLTIFLPFVPSLVIESKDGKVLYCSTWENGSTFELFYLHSVNKSPVTDLFTVKDGKILLIASRFQSFGAGVAALPEESGGQLRIATGYLEYGGIEREIPELGVFVPREANTLFRYGKETLPLNQLASPGTLVKIRFTHQAFAARFIQW